MSNRDERHHDTDTARGDAMPARAATDSLATGVAFMLGLAVVQRLIGFVRSILFCGIMQDDELGRWSLAFSFLVLAAPLAVVGLPGSFGRYVEHYRSRGQLGTFLRRTIVVSLVLATATITVFVCWGSFWAWLILGDAALAPTMRLLAMALVAVIVFNFVTELLTAMRKVRAVSVMQFVSSMLFAVLAIGLLSFTALRADAIIIAFGVASFVSVLIVIGPLRDIRDEAIDVSVPLSQRSLWEKLVPFAAWIWATNLLANMFDAADRFMIVHFAKEGATSAESLVGQYHASRVVPFLLISVTAMIAAVVLPYLTHDWEAARRHAVLRRQVLILKLGGLILTTCGLLLLLAAPVLFTWILHGKYDQGLAVLPWTVAYCLWFSMILLAQNYLLCAEKARLGTLAFFIGLMINLALNVVLLPRFGLIGAIMATAAGNAVALALTLYFCNRHGLGIDRKVILCCCLPAVLILGIWPALGVFVATVFFATRDQWLFDRYERDELLQVVFHFTNCVRQLAKKWQTASA